jgi:hypothetical protein
MWLGDVHSSGKDLYGRSFRLLEDISKKHEENHEILVRGLGNLTDIRNVRLLNVIPG